MGQPKLKGDKRLRPRYAPAPRPAPAHAPDSQALEKKQVTEFRDRLGAESSRNLHKAAWAITLCYETPALSYWQRGPGFSPIEGCITGRLFPETGRQSMHKSFHFMGLHEKTPSTHLTGECDHMAICEYGQAGEDKLFFFNNLPYIIIVGKNPMILSIKKGFGIEFSFVTFLVTSISGKVIFLLSQKDLRVVCGKVGVL